ncbi:MAG: insulinase family protein [Verrucomicrobia bacterium]|nr:insulinase family protein [Verrucomicrobiota bacterium]
MRREQVAVDQEFLRAMASDGWRQELVMRHLNREQHPDSRFGMGNSQTLNPLTSAQARQWFEKHYSANLSHLVVYSSYSTREMQEMVERYFSQIPNRHIEPFTVLGRRRGYKTKEKLVAIEPHAEVRELTLTWELPYNYRSDLEGHVPALVAFILGSEGEGSLLAHLKQEGLAETISAGRQVLKREDTPTMLFHIVVGLTPEGVKQKNQVIQEVFGLIDLLATQGVPSYIFDEIKTMNQLNYEYQSRISPFDLVSYHAKELIEEPLATYPDQTILPSYFDQEACSTLVDQLKPRTAHITLLAPLSESSLKATEKEPYMGVEFTIEPIERETFLNWEHPQTSSDLSLPPPNPYLPTALEVSYQGRPREEMGTPLLLQDNDFGQAYYLQDKNFLSPQIAWNFLIKSNQLRPGNARSAALLDLWVRAVSENLTQVTYAASLAGLGFILEAKAEGVMLSVAGYSEQGALFLQQIANHMRNIPLNEEEFLRHKESLAADYRNKEKEPPVQQAMALTKRVLFENYVPEHERLQELKELSYGAFLLFADSFFDATYLSSALFGNLTRENAEELLRDFSATCQQNPYPEGKTLHPKIATLSEHKGPYLLSKPIQMEGNAALLAIEQGPYTPQRHAAQIILTAGLEEPFFTSLRTKQQTGYVVLSWGQELERHLFTFFAVQSTTIDGRDLVARYEQMIEEFLRAMESRFLTQDRFEDLKNASIAKLKMAPKNPKAMSDRLFELAFHYDGDFDWHQKQIAALEELSYADFLLLARESLGQANKRRLGILIEGKISGDSGLRYKSARTPSKLRSLSKYSSRSGLKN